MSEENRQDETPLETPDAHIETPEGVCPHCGRSDAPAVATGPCTACNGTGLKITSTATGTTTEACPVCRPGE